MPSEAKFSRARHMIGDRCGTRLCDKSISTIMMLTVDEDLFEVDVDEDEGEL